MWFLNLFKKQSKIIKPIVVGYPRTGFTLLISIITEVLSKKKQINQKNEFINNLEKNGDKLSEKIYDFLKNKFAQKEIIFNKNFRKLLGGPNWIETRDNKEVVCVRKYLGIKNLGDLTLIISLPIKVLDSHIVPHSHGPYKYWTNYKKKFTSIRSCTGTINSACHSINAIASEYIQKYYPNLTDQETEKLRVDLAASKLSNIHFFNAMIKPMKENFLELINFNSKFHIHKWENIINNPLNEILKISKNLNIDIDKSEAIEIWEKLKFRNLTQSHKHNYRKNKAYVGDEFESLTNDHIEILKQNDFDYIHAHLGYKKLEYIDKSKYTDFQTKISTYIEKNEILDEISDRELYWFAFQKSNLDFSRFPFKLYDWKKYTKIERTNIKNEKLVNEIWQIAEYELEKINNFINNYI